MGRQMTAAFEAANYPVFCFQVESDYIGKTYAYVNAPDLNIARARMVPLFPRCKLIPVEVSTVVLPG